MFDELQLANKLLNTALDRYLDACGGVRDYYLRSGSLASIPPKFTNHVGSELSSFPGLEEKLRKAKLLVSWSHNCSTNLSPINLLPPEILLYIFQLAIPRLCFNQTLPGSHTYAPSRTPPGSLAYPDTLMHVCSRWRYIALNAPTLWSHIDLQTDKALLYGGWIVERAEAHANRAGQLLLDVHLPVSFSQTDLAIIEDLSRLLSGPTISTRARSVEVGFTGDINLEAPVLQPLSRFFENCRPGTLTRLTIHSKETSGSGLFIYGQGEPRPYSEPTVILLDLPQDQLDAVLLGVTALQLRMIHFPWASPAYRGLVELRLTGGFDCIFITKSQLVGMLQANPRLRILEFGLRIRRKSPEDTPIVPIQLTDLEALELTLCGHFELDFLLQRVAPGSRPLQLSLFGGPAVCSPDELVNSTQPFMNRSNTRILHLFRPGINHALALVNAFPQIQTLVMRWSRLDDPISIDKTRFGPCRLESLYLLKTWARPDELVAMLGLCPTRTLVLWDARFDSNSDHSGQHLDDAIFLKLSGVCGDVRWVSRSAPNPTKDWNLCSWGIVEFE